MADFTIYTDGGCHGNPGPGGWAFLIVSPEGERLVGDSGFDPATTNNRMELTAVIQGLRRVQTFRDPGSHTVVTDSQYVRMGITEWIRRWSVNGWRTAGKKPVKNVDLWKELKILKEEIDPHWEWVKGHAGNRFNEECDEMVQKIIAVHGQS
jgi:ribonuclease HI